VIVQWQVATLAFAVLPMLIFGTTSPEKGLWLWLMIYCIELCSSVTICLCASDCFQMLLVLLMKTMTSFQIARVLSRFHREAFIRKTFFGPDIPRHHQSVQLLN
jgi:hypothetical protein